MRVSHRSRIERYKPEELLGSSGLVDTYRVRVEDGNERAVLKVLFLDRADEHSTRPAAERFLAAGRRARALPAVCSVLDVSDDIASAFIASALVPGLDLSAVVEHERGRSSDACTGLDPARAAVLCVQVARALATAHACGPPLHHLGLCPSNVLVDATGSVRLLDFGLAATYRGVGTYPMAKWQFVAPELLGVTTPDLSPAAARAADLYGVGVLLYFLLEGALPGAWTSAASLPALGERKQVPLALPTRVPVNMQAIARALTDPSPTSRPDSLQSVIDWLAKESAPEPEQILPRVLAPSDAPAASPSASPARAPSQRAQGMHLTEQPRKNGSVAARTASATVTRAAAPAARFTTGKLLALVAALASGFAYYAYRRPVSRQHPAHTVAPSSPASPAAAEKNPGGVRAPATSMANPELPALGHGYVPDPDHPPARVPGRLFLDTSPTGAEVWIDGSARGKSPVDLALGPGSHRMVAIKAGYLMWRAVYDTTGGEFARRELQPVNPPIAGNAFLAVDCPAANRFPIVVDDEETGLLCPVARLPVAAGKHSVGIFVPARRATVAVEIEVAAGRQPKRIVLRD